MHRLTRVILFLASCTAMTAPGQGWRSFFRSHRASGQSDSPLLYVRLVRALESADASSAPDPALADVLPTLQETLRFRSYRLTAAKRTRVRNGLVLDLPPLRLRFSEVQGNSFRLEVEQNGRPVLRSRVRLRPGRPVVVGGLPSDGGALLLVFVRGKPSK